MLNGKATRGYELRLSCESCRSQPVKRAGVIHSTRTRRGSPAFAVGDLDGDGRPEVVVSEQPIVQGVPVTEVTALDGQSGTARWVLARSAPAAR